MRILTVADVYEALTANRPYRAALPPEHALEVLGAAGRSELDPEVIGALAGALASAPLLAA